jgi:hypothetical protein
MYPNHAPAKHLVVKDLQTFEFFTNQSIGNGKPEQQQYDATPLKVLTFNQTRTMPFRAYCGAVPL